MKRLLILPVLALLVGCTSFSTHVFRTEQTAVELAYSAYIGYTNSLLYLAITPDQSNAIKQARLKFAATVGTVEALRGAYETNSAVKPQLEAITSTLLDQGSNIVWLINFVKSK